MKIYSGYIRLINSLLVREKSPAGNQRIDTAPGGKAEQKEISGLSVLVKQELEKLEQAVDPERSAYLQSLKAKIERGEYRVDPQALARAMLDQTAPPEKG